MSTDPQAPQGEVPQSEVPRHQGSTPDGFDPREFFTPAMEAPLRIELVSEDEPALFQTFQVPVSVRHIPHLGHAVLFVVMTCCLLALTVAGLVFVHHPHGTAQIAADAQRPLTSILSELIAYLLTLGFSALLFPLMWDRPFLAGIEWNVATARSLAARLIPFGIVLSFAVEALNAHLPQPKDMPIDHFFRNQGEVWLIAIFGTLIAPAFEEILFRGFLLPAFAIAWDWIALQRDSVSLAHWDTTDIRSRPALVFAAIVSSVLFAGLHSAQLAGSHSAVATLFAVSLVFSYMRLRYRSVAVSTLMHASYNFTIFFMLFLATGGFRHLDRLNH